MHIALRGESKCGKSWIRQNNIPTRIQKGNMRTVLQKLEELQVDNEGRGLVIDYDEADEKIIAVERQLLFYRKFLTAKWPWEDMIKELKEEKILHHK